MKHLAWLLLPVSCALQAPPVVPPADGPGSCETASQTLARLGWCGVASDGWVERCHDEERASEADAVRLPVGCLTAAASCEEAMSCR